MSPTGAPPHREDRIPDGSRQDVDTLSRDAIVGQIRELRRERQHSPRGQALREVDEPRLVDALEVHAVSDDRTATHRHARQVESRPSAERAALHDEILDADPRLGSALRTELDEQGRGGDGAPHRAERRRAGSERHEPGKKHEPAPPRTRGQDRRLRRPGGHESSQRLIQRRSASSSVFSAPASVS